MIEINNIWNMIKNITIVISIIMIISMIVIVLIVLTHKISIYIDESGEAITTEDIPLTMPISFDMGPIKIKGDADVVIPKETKLPVKIKMTVPLLKAIRITSNKQIETTVTDTTQMDSTTDTKDTATKSIKDAKDMADTINDAKQTADTIKDAKDIEAKSIKDAKDTKTKTIKDAKDTEDKQNIKDEKLKDLSDDK